MILRKIILIFMLVIIGLPAIGLSQSARQESKSQELLAKVDTTMWKFLAASDRSQWVISSADSENALRNCFLPGYNIFKTVTEIYDKIGKKKTTIEQEASNLISLQERVKAYFEEGLRLNPFDSYLRTGITTTYSNLEKLYLYQNEPAKRLGILQNLLYLKKDPKARLDLYNNIGMIYRQFEIWDQARDNYQLAVETIFAGDESAIDTMKLFENLYWRGYAQLRLYEAEPALTSFTYARMIAPNENYYDQLTTFIEFINWDGGNIRASEKYKEAKRLSNEKKYAEAEIVFLELLGMVSTEKATNEAKLALAKMQFYALNKKDEALERLWNVVNKYPLDPNSGVPIDTTYQDFWIEYAQMCLRMGVSYFNTDKRSSFTYFLKTSQIDGPSRGQAFLNLAMMSSINPQLCINFCTRALDYLDQLDQDEKRLLYQTIYQAYFQQGEFEQALKWFKKYYEIAS